ncbi:MAG: trypsin-like peptidase domain-containing protein [Bacteroidota bacterium]|nr:trypsin-like peptidase domain-containing protein [Bacteroidota bacterium]
MRIFSPSLTLSLFLLSTTSNAQVSFGGRPLGHSHPETLPPTHIVRMPSVDAAALIAEDEARIAQGIKGPWRFGFNHMVDLGLENSGAWHELGNGDRVWRLSIECPGAYSINFEFHDYVIPEGAQVFVYNDEEFLGSFDQRSNPGETVLGVTQLAGDRITIEYIEPADVNGSGSLRVGQVTHAYRNVLGKMRGLGDSGSCNNNVICPVGDEWRDQIRSVAMMTVGGSGFCTGQLINNCANDGTPYFLTANHCISGTTSTWVYRFNWESPQCNVNQNGPTNQTVSGSSIKETSAATDVALLELNTIPPASYDVFYSGWDISATPPTSSTAIHHPSGDIKKISFDEQAALSASFGGASCWRIASWEDGTTEPGSSGSGLWNQDGLLVGQLYGGQASCQNNVNDYYGRFDLSYPLLEDWLGDCGNELQGFPFSTSINAVDAMLDLEIHPNPASGIIIVQLPAAAVGDFVINIHDATGRIVHQRPMASGNSSITMDLHHLPEGIYVLELKGTASRAIERLVLTH